MALIFLKESEKPVKPTRAVLRCVILMLLMSIVLSVVSAIRFNQNLKSNFVPNGKKWPLFQQNAPLKEIYRPYYDSGSYAADFIILYQVDITLNYPIRYYDRIAIAGTSFSQGLNSCPTYQKGWRYARTLPERIESDSAAHQLLSSPNQWYYVRLEDLKRVRFHIVIQDEIRWMQEKLDNPIRQWRWLWQATELLEVDRLLYKQGDYLSPDLFKPLWDWKCTALTIGIILLIIPERLLAKRENRRQPSSGS